MKKLNRDYLILKLTVVQDSISGFNLDLLLTENTHTKQINTHLCFQFSPAEYTMHYTLCNEGSCWVTAMNQMYAQGDSDQYKNAEI